VQETLERGIDVVLEIDWQGARQVRAQFVDALSIFIIPPSEEALIQRLNNRDQDNQDVVESRMNEAKNEISHYTEYDFLVCNDQFEQALSELKTIVCCNRLKLRSQQYHLMHIMSKLID
jgi:guanylate kinase